MAFKKLLPRLAVFCLLVLVPMTVLATPPPPPTPPGGPGGTFGGGAGGAVGGVPSENLYRPRPDIFLLQPVDNQPTLPNNGTIQVAFEYFNRVWPWIYGSAAGIAVIWAMFAGVLIMSSGENSDLRNKGKNHLMAVTAGLILIALSGLVLTTLNSLFFK